MDTVSSSTTVNYPKTSHRMLHWVFKIGNLKKSLEFYEGVLGMHVLRHEEFNQGCEAECNGSYSRPWSKTMVGWGDELNHFVFELTYNYGIKTYQRGNDLRHIVVNSDDDERVAQLAMKQRLNVHPMSSGFMITDPDGYLWHVVPSLQNQTVSRVSINVKDLQLSQLYYANILGMRVFAEGSDSVRLGWALNQTQLEIFGSNQNIDHAGAYGRLAMTCENVKEIESKVANSGHKIQHGPIKLDTPGKATVEVVILQDPDDYELCFVEVTGFDELSKPVPGAEKIDWQYRKEYGADKD